MWFSEAYFGFGELFGMSDDICVTVKPAAGGEKFSITVKSSFSVGEVKEEIGKKVAIEASQQRLIFKGQILKDELTIASYGE